MTVVVSTLDTVPQEVLEHIAFFSATHSFLGPPSGLVPLLLTNRKVHSDLSIASNHHLYARVFAHKFDLTPVVRRLGPDRATPCILARQLQRRCFYLKRIRARLDSTANKSSSVDGDKNTLRDLLYHAYLLMLDNEGKNERQLRDYARVDDWLREYWFADSGASRAKLFIRADRWLPETPETSLAMWLFWFFLKPDSYTKDDEASWTALNILKIYALAAHKYDLTTLSWIDFAPELCFAKSDSVIHHCESYQLTPPPLAAPAILSFLALVNTVTEGVGHSYSTPLAASVPPLTQESHEWGCEWGRCISLGQNEFDKFLTDSFRPGSVEGVWEGLFTYTEFTAYAALLAGAPPPVLQKSMVVRHRQTWKLREHHLVAADPSHSDSGIEMDCDGTEPLPAGDPLRSYFPTGTHIKEHRFGIEVYNPHSRDTLHYQRASTSNMHWNSDEPGRPYVQDVIITGEGHSAWGQFNLIGRVRPSDGFVSLSKEYVDGDRGKWLYRGYLVGNVNGNLAGRWRDTLSPADVSGYEGCFAMSRRR